LAQDFVGSNNLNLLMPNGQFGTRIMGGHDSASSRYIHTELSRVVPFLFPSADFPLLTYNEDDGQSVEPIYYLPVIPLVLVNGQNGIGTGFSSSIPKYSLKDVTGNIIRRLQGSGYEEIHPRYNGFGGQIVKLDETSYMSKGVYETVNDTTIVITELPIGKWTDDYKKFLDTLLEDEPSKKKSNEKPKKKPKYTIVDYVNNSSDTRIHFTITVPPGFCHSLQWSEDPHIDGIEKYFKLTNTKGLSLSNIHLYNEKQQIQKYPSVTQIFDDFYEKRHELYVKRKEFQCVEFERIIAILSAKVRFITEVIEDVIVIYRRKKTMIVADLRSREYPQLKDKRLVADDQMDESTETANYDYLIKMSLYHFTEEEIIKLTKEHDDTVASYKVLQGKSVEDIWLKECRDLLKSVK
jgi:DNA topoisomerase-2